MLRREREVPLRKEPKKPVTAKTSGSSSGKGRAKAAAVELPEALLPAFEALRAWRAEQAREQGVPAYVIFHDATLREIATEWPTSVRQLGGISGVGEKKLATYGEGVIGVLASLGEAPDPAAAAPASGTGTGTVTGPMPAAKGVPSVDTGSDDYWPEMDAEPEPEDWM